MRGYWNNNYSSMKLHGFSLVELMLAGALFTLFASGVVEVILTGLENNRLGEETTIATEYASEGIEAVRSIRAKNFDDLTLSDATGIDRDSGDWRFAGSENTHGKYTRVIAVEPVNRDGNGDIDEHGGDTDPDTLKVIVTVSWRVTPTRPDSVVLQTFLTRFKPSI